MYAAWFGNAFIYIYLDVNYRDDCSIFLICPLLFVFYNLARFYSLFCFFVCIFLYVIFSLFCTFFLLFVIYLTPSSPSFIILFEKYIVIFLIIFIGTYIEIRDWLEIKIRNAEVCFSYFFVNYIAFPIFVFVSVFWNFRLTFDVIRYLFILLSSNWLWVFLVHVVLKVQLWCKDFPFCFPLMLYFTKPLSQRDSMY